MKLLILAVIKCYWWIVPEKSRRRCLFARSCSRHVFDVASRAGGLAGLQAFRSRYRTCRPGYRPLSAVDSEGSALLRLADGSVVRADQLSPAIVSACFHA